MSSKELVVKNKDKEVMLPTKAYNPEVTKVTAETHYRTPFNQNWLRSVKDSWGVTLPGMLGLELGAFVVAPLDWFLFNPGILDPLILAVGIASTTAAAIIAVSKIDRKNKSRYIVAKNIIKKQFSVWLEERYSLEVENEELEKIVNYISYPKNIKGYNLRFISNANEPYVLKSDDSNIWYVEPYTEPIELKANEKLAYTPVIAKVLEPNKTNNFNEEQQSIHEMITGKLSTLKGLKLDTEKTFIMTRIDTDLRETSKLNTYGNSLNITHYDPSKITTILTLLNKEIDAVFEDELNILVSSLDAKIELITNRIPVKK
jgi:hypothetical protein